MSGRDRHLSLLYAERMPAGWISASAETHDTVQSSHDDDDSPGQYGNHLHKPQWTARGYGGFLLHVWDTVGNLPKGEPN